MNNPFQQNLSLLKLSYLQQSSDTYFQSFGKQEEFVRRLVEDLVEKEVTQQKKASLERRFHQAKIGPFSQMIDFDWTWPTKISRKSVEEVLSLEFLTRKENIILMGPEGVGKTMIAQNLAYLCAFSGSQALFTTAADLVVRLKEAQSSPSMVRSRLQRYLRPRLLVIDEIGYLSFDNKAADLLFQVVSKRYERSSTVITTNLAFKDWPKFFPGASSVTALIDRLVHRSHIINIEGESFRLKESKNKNLQKGT